MASEDVTLQVGIEADASDAVRDMRQAASAAASLADSFREIATVAVSAARALTRVEQGVTGTGRQGKNAVAGIRSTTSAIQEQTRAVNELANAQSRASSVRNRGNIHTPGTGSTRVSSTGGDPNVVGIGITRQERESINASNFAREQAIKIRQREQSAIRQTVLANIAENKAWRENNDVRKLTSNSASEVAGRMMNLNGTLRDTVGHTNQVRDSLFTARFALHDISNATGVAGAALLAFNAVTIKAAADYESAMAAIQRTSGATVSQMSVIQDQFVDLAQTVPAGFQNLAQIGELAGQLNIPADLITNFTETVAKFTSSTDVAVQQSAEAFGRLDALLPDVQGNYEALGSSILNVGVNSVATESAIISTTTQIAAAGAQARFSADEIIGLAASYASLGIAPEAARGSTIRIFSEIREAVNAGGSSLEEFARLAGYSAEQFQSAWNSGDTSQVFMDFLKGLQEEGTNAETVLRNLGITGVRDINALLRLSQNLDIVTQSFGYASDGFEQATQLTEAFGITSETLNARLDLLGQSIQALFAELGSTGTGPIKEFVNALIELIKFTTELSRNPVAQWVAIFAGLFTLLAGGVLILTSLVARMGAMAIATRTVNIELRTMAENAKASGGAMGALQSRIVGAGIAMTQFKNILRGLMWGTAITAGITLLIAGIEMFGEATKSAGDKAKDAFGDLTGLTNALQADTRIYKETGDALGFVEGQLTITSDRAADWVKALESATDSQTSLGDESDHTTQTIRNQTFAIGENTAAWLANQLANNDSIKKAFELNSQLAQAGAPTIDTKGLIEASVSNDVARAREIVRAWFDEYTEYIKSAPAPVDAIEAGAAFTEIYNLSSGALEEAAMKGEVTSAVFNALGIDANTAALGMAELGDESSGAAAQLDVLRGAVEAAFGGLSGILDWGSAIESLFGGLARSGVTSLEVLGAAGATNLANLQTAIVTTIAAGETMGVSAVDSVTALFLTLQARGIETANLLASLASIPGIGASGVASVESALAGQSALTGSAAQLQDTLAGVAASAANAARSIGGGGGGRGGGGGGLGGAAKDAAKEVRTLVDYANDLEKVFKRAFDIRFGSMQALDNITLQWIEMRDAIDEANDKIDEHNRKIGELQTENSTLQYFLGVAQDYGDAIRAAEISEEIAKNNAEMAKETEEAAEAAETLDKGLVGNTKSAIENREQILGLVGHYQDLITAYAESGMDSTQLAAKTAQLKQEFIAQARQLGFSTAQIEMYAASFDDITLAIQKVPRNVTVKADVNPAIQALREFEAQAKKSATNAANAIRTGGGGGYSVPKLNVGVGTSALYGVGQIAGAEFKRGFRVGFNGALLYSDGTGQFRGSPGSIKFLKSGGYTGNAPVNQETGIVHGKEFVVNAQNTKRLGLPFLNSLNSGGLPTAPVPVNSGIMVVELSATDRQLLARAGNVSLSIDGKVIATAANSANFVAGKRGSN